MTPAERKLRARIAAHKRWADTSMPERIAATAPARRAAAERFERQVDPEGKLSAAERIKRADHARREYMLRLSLKSVRSRRAAVDEGAR